MTRALCISILLASILGCSPPLGPQPVAEDPIEGGVTIVEGSQVDLASLVGKEVTLVGVQTRTKIPTVCGVDVDGDYEHSDTKVTATGILQRREVAPRGADEPIVASRGPGIYYSLHNPAGGLARTRPYTGSD